MITWSVFVPFSAVAVLLWLAGAVAALRSKAVCLSLIHI